MSVEHEWSKAIQETEVLSLSEIWIVVFVGGGVSGTIVAALSLTLGTVLSTAALAGVGACMMSCVVCLIDRREKQRRRQSFVNMLLAKISDGMEASEFRAVLSALADLGPSAVSALPWIDEIQMANLQSANVCAACNDARQRIQGRPA